MEITGRKNLELTKKALQDHIVVLSRKALHSSDEETKRTIDPEITETNTLLDAVEINLKRLSDTEE